MSNLRTTSINNLVNSKIGNKLIISFKGENSCGHALFEYECECGNKGVTTISNIKRTPKCKKCCDFKPKKFFNKGEVGLNKLYANYKDGAIKRNYMFELTLEQFQLLTSNNCHYCNDKPSNVIRTRRNKKDYYNEYNNYIYNGIDRVDNKLGYITANCVTCCEKCNKSKLDMSYEEFKNHILKIYANWANK